MQWKGREIARVVIIQELDKSMECFGERKHQLGFIQETYTNVLLYYVS